MSNNDEDIPTVEFEGDEYWEDNEPRARRSEQELADEYLRLQFENYSEETLREVHGDDYEDELRRYEALVHDSDRAKHAPRIEKGHAPEDYVACDDALLDAHEKAVQWKAGESPDDVDITKSPGIWESDDEVPEWVLEALEELIRTGDVVWQGGYEKLPPSAEAEIQRILEDRMTQPQGWSLGSLLRDLQDHYPNKDDDYLLTILRNETSAVLNTAREEAYAQRDDYGSYLFDWIGPTDHRTTDTCLSIEDRVEDEGGAVSMERLKEILYEEAVAHADAEGTPERADDWQPHHQCRRTFVRRARTI